MNAHYEDGPATVWHGDCIDVMRTLPDASVDAVVTDPPYSLEFMGREWDRHENEDAGFGYYLAGLIDGEGHFRVDAKGRRCEFALKLRDDDERILRRAMAFVGHGRITHEARTGTSNPVATLVIDTKDGVAALCALLMRYPLRAKKLRDFILWAEAVDEWLSIDRGNRWHGAADRTRLRVLGERLREGRSYSEIAWSGNGFQDWCRQWATEAYRLLKPGGHLLAFGGTRTFHRLATGIEDAGFEIRDSIAWLYGSGFPKSLDVSKAIDKVRTEDHEPTRVVCRAIRAAMDARGLRSRDLVEHFDGCHPRLVDHWAARDTDSQPSLPKWDQWEVLRDVLGLGHGLDAEVWRLNGRKGAPGEAWESREVIGESEHSANRATNIGYGSELEAEGRRLVTAPATPDAARWTGWGTALKPAFEPVVVARKPLAGTVAANVLTHGTGALNIDANRIGTGDDRTSGGAAGKSTVEHVAMGGGWNGGQLDRPTGGRWPANVVLDASQAAALDTQSGERSSGLMFAGQARQGKPSGILGEFKPDEVRNTTYGDTGGASRFFKTVDDVAPRFMYTAKAGSDERPTYSRTGAPTPGAAIHANVCATCGRQDLSGSRCECPDPQWVPRGGGDAVSHPTVKPLDLMRWLVRLVTPKGGTVLEPFAGSGTTVEAAVLEGFRCIAIEREADYLPLILQRIRKPHAVGLDFDFGDWDWEAGA